ncbi:MAG: hypothetical protein HPY44_09680 [Armatimonadetes bacterium]|nr:hypothetical protein [Armatimonadota bacterium]
MSAEIAQRRAEYVDWIVEHFSALEPHMHPADGRRWALNHARLLRGHDLDDANRYFESFEVTRDSDIFFIRFLRTLLDTRGLGRLSAAGEGRILSVLRDWPRNDLSSVAKWPPAHTENHDLMHLTIGLFSRHEVGEDTSGQVAQIMQALRWRFERGFIEWNSACYQFHYSNPLIILADYAPDEPLRRCADALLNVLLAERAALGVRGFLGGPSFRCRTADAKDSPNARKVAYLEDPRYDAFLPTVWLAFGLGEPRFDFTTSRVEGLEPATVEYASGNEPRLKQDEGMFFACSDFVPHPLVAALAAESLTRSELVYRGRRYLGWPGAEHGETHWESQKWMPGAINYYNTPHVSMGSIHSDGWICQSRYSKVFFAADPSQGLRVEMILPGVPPHKRRYEARGRVVQHRNWLLGQGTLFEDGGITARSVGGWNLYAVGAGLCAHFALPDSYHVLQASDLDQHPSEEAFLQALRPPVMTGGQVRATLLNADSVCVDLSDMSIAINGVPRPHPPAMLHDCEALRSEYGSGEITIHTGQGSVTFTPDGPRD